MCEMKPIIDPVAREEIERELTAEKKIRNGMTLVMPGLVPGKYRVYGGDGSFLALCEANQGKLFTVKSFFEV